ncbi:MAG TPA: endonuclease/exonuclease/phosphatase family protein [Gemmatimonadales bacterium]|nr:endonuclease/exonuclease/phosphatase family protein [Gemmatimonadales bacterium]
MAGRRGPRGDVIVRCGGGTHWVRIDPARFWQTARCPACRAAVDPTRAGRVLRWLLLRMAARGTDVRRITPALAMLPLAWAALAVMVAATTILWRFGDRWWPATAALYGPRWLVLPPLLLLAALALVTAMRRGSPARRALVPTAAAVGLALGPFLGFRFGWRSLLPEGDPDTALRIVTYNVEGGELVAARLDELIRETRANILAFQECGPGFTDSLAARPGWRHHAARRGNPCLLTRFPIEAVDTIPTWEAGGFGGSGNAVRYRLRTPAGPVTLVNLHLETPRRGLELLRYGGSAGRMEGNTTVREIGSERVRAWIRDIQGPFVVAGDFNMPVESRIYARYWADLPNAFGTAGRGFGWTRVLKRFRVRIDHVLTGGGARARRARLGPDLGSDHLPMVTVIRLPGS